MDEPPAGGGQSKGIGPPLVDPPFNRDKISARKVEVHGAHPRRVEEVLRKPGPPYGRIDGPGPVSAGDDDGPPELGPHHFEEVNKPVGRCDLVLSRETALRAVEGKLSQGEVR
jgi:hypothetical protein